MISTDNKNNCDFCLISNGRCFLQAMNNIKDIKEKEHKKFKFKKICIFCLNKENYLTYLKKYNNLEGIYTTEDEVIQFIGNNSLSKTTVYKSLKIMTYEKYSKKYYKIHHIISKYYREDPGDNFSKFYNIIKEEFQNNNKLLGTFEKFENQTNSQNATELIKEYTFDSNECLYKVLNTKWLLNLEKWSLDKKINNGWLDRIKNFFSELNFFNKKKSFDDDYLSSEKKAYFIGQFMFKVNFKINEEKNNNNEFYNRKELKLYRGMTLDNIEALSYPIELGEVITFPTFISTSKELDVAKRFAKINDLKEKKKEHKYSIIFNITIKQNIELFPLYFKIRETYYNNEEEFLFNPFTFFKINDYKFDYNNKNLFLELEAIGKKGIIELYLDETHKLIYKKEKNIVGYEKTEYYIGKYLNGLRSGKGTLYYGNDHIKYEGDFSNDKFEGNGRYNYEDGEYYIGQFLNGLRNGKGTLYYGNGHIKYEGDFSNDKFEGNGRYNYEDGEYYIGQFLNGKKHGKGKYYLENGKYYVGQWINDNRHGECNLYESNNSIIMKFNFENGNLIERTGCCNLF